MQTILIVLFASIGLSLANRNEEPDRFGCWNTCRFPFYDKGVEYNECKKSEESTSTWCRVQQGYEDWSPNDVVACPTECKCNFPFLKNGILYRYCIYDNSERPWCSTVPTFDDHPDHWVYCQEKCDPDPCQGDELCVNVGDDFKCLKNIFKKEE